MVKLNAFPVQMSYVIINIDAILIGIAGLANHHSFNPNLCSFFIILIFFSKICLALYSMSKSFKYWKIPLHTVLLTLCEGEVFSVFGCTFFLCACHYLGAQVFFLWFWKYCMFKNAFSCKQNNLVLKAFILYYQLYVIYIHLSLKIIE